MSQPGSTGPGNVDRGDARLRRAAELVLSRELLPGPAPLPDFRSLLALRAHRRRRAWLAAGGACTGVVALAIVLVFGERAPISYVVDGAVAISDGVIDAVSPAAGGARGGPSGPAAASGSDVAARVQFSEGTEVALTSGARIRVVDRSERGAALALDRGHARFSVTHRAGARWTVATGPFTIDVVGTRFAADWSPSDGRLVVELTSGSVQVRGASVGGPVVIHAGERLTATAADRRVTLSPLGAQPPGADSTAGANGAATAGATAAVASTAPRGIARASSRGHRASRRLKLALVSPGRGAGAGAGAGGVGSRPPTPGSPFAPYAPGRPAADESSFDGEPPPPVLESRPTPGLPLAAGGGTCASGSAQYRFERPESGISVPPFYTLALSNPRQDHTHSWCGQTSIRADASFNDVGRRNYFGRFPNETGQIIIRLDRSTNFTDKTLTAHFYVDGPADARFSAELFVVHRGRWVASRPVDELRPGRWWTISQRFDVENQAGVSTSSNPTPYPAGVVSRVSDCDRVALAIHSTGDRRVWTGAVYVDDVGWK